MSKETTPQFRYEITIDLREDENPADVYDAVEDLLHKMGEIGTLSMRSMPDDD